MFWLHVRVKWVPDLQWGRLFLPDQISRSCWGSEAGKQGVGGQGGALGAFPFLELIWHFLWTNPCYRRPEPLVVPFLSSFSVTFVASFICTKSLQLVMAFLWSVFVACVEWVCAEQLFPGPCRINVCHMIACDFMTSVAEVSPVGFLCMCNLAFN